MTVRNEHDDDLEPEVNVGAEIETEEFEEADDEEEGILPDADATNSSDGIDEPSVPAGDDDEEALLSVDALGG